MLAVAPHVAAADCKYTREKFEQYSSRCQAIDGCAYLDQMKQVVTADCGADEPLASPTLSMKPAKRQPAEPPAQPAQAPVLSASSAYDKALQQQQARENDPYKGEACQYFTRDSVESDGLVTRMNYHAEGARVCYQGRMYQCRNGRWDVLNECTEYPNWRERRAEKLEASRF